MEAEAVILALGIVVLWMLGLVAGASLARPGVTEARIRLRAYRALLKQERNLDETVCLLVDRQIQRLERRLHIGDDDRDE